MALENRELAGEPTGIMSLSGIPIKEYIEEPDLPNNARKLATCMQHMDEGEFSALTGDWYMGGCEFPKDDEPQIVRFQHVCPGPGLIRECRLRIVQYDEHGKKIGGLADAFRDLKVALVTIRNEKKETRAK